MNSIWIGEIYSVSRTCWWEIFPKITKPALFHSSKNSIELAIFYFISVLQLLESIFSLVIVTITIVYGGNILQIISRGKTHWGNGNGNVNRKNLKHN